MSTDSRDDSFVEGPRFALDLARIDVDEKARDRMMFALQEVLLSGEGIDAVSHLLSPDRDIRYLRSREFPSLDMPPLYLTFRFERAGLIALRRVFTDAEVRRGDVDLNELA